MYLAYTGFSRFAGMKIFTASPVVADGAGVERTLNTWHSGRGMRFAGAF
jgi:hypothetical protein